MSSRQLAMTATANVTLLSTALTASQGESTNANPHK